jgi:hypothetical protein
MDVVRYYVDEHIPRAVVRALRARGVGVMTVSEAGLRTASDEAHLSHALSQQRVMVTYDSDFLRLHGGCVEHAGIAYAPRLMPVGALVRRLLVIHDVLAADEMRGHVEFL